MKHSVRLYNVIFPLWMLLFFPVTWLLVIPANFVFDSLILLVAVRVMKLPKKKELYVKSIFRVWIFGFLADLVGAAWMLLIYGIAAWSDLIGYEVEFIEAFMVNPWKNFFALAFTVVALLISGGLIYFLNRRWTFESQPLTDRVKRHLSLCLAVTTAPYFFLIPLNWLI